MLVPAIIVAEPRLLLCRELAIIPLVLPFPWEVTLVSVQPD